MSSNLKQPRQRSLAAAVELAQKGAAGLEDPFAGVISERALLYAPPSGHCISSWGFDGTPGSSQRVHVRRDGYSSAHVGGCAIEPAEPLAERLIRQAGLDRDEAEYVRDVFASPSSPPPARARLLGISLRTMQRRDASVRAKVEQAKPYRCLGCKETVAERDCSAHLERCVSPASACIAQAFKPLRLEDFVWEGK